MVHTSTDHASDHCLLIIPNFPKKSKWKILHNETKALDQSAREKLLSDLYKC